MSRNMVKRNRKHIRDIGKGNIMHNRVSGLMVMALLLLLVSPALASDAEHYMVEIRIAAQSYLEYIPWQRTNIAYRAGIGVPVEGGLILTTAHLIRDAVIVELQKEGQNRRWPGTVHHVDYDAGLALIKPEDPTFMETLTIPQFSADYHTGAQIMLGRRLRDGRLAFYQGVITEIFACSPRHGSNRYPFIKADTMMQSGGNSEIAMIDDVIIGLCYMATDNQVEIIPYDTISTYLELHDSPQYTGFPANYMRKTGMDDNNLRDYLAMPDELTGMMISNTRRAMPYSSFFQPYDVLLSVDGYDIDNSGLIHHQKFGRIDFDIMLTLNRSPGDTVNIELFRDGNVITHDLKLEAFDKDAVLIPEHIVDERPAYIVYGGLLMTHLTKSFLQEWGSEWSKRAPVSMVTAYYDNYMASLPDKNRLVVMREVFAHDINRGYQNLGYITVSTVNGIDIRDLSDVKRALSLPREYDIIEFDNTAFKVVFERNSVLEANQEIEQTYSITESEFLP